MIYIALAIVWILVAISLHEIGVANGWYGKFWWYDHVTHFVSGGAVIFCLILLFGKVLIVWPLFVLLVAIWEIVEYIIGPPSKMWHSFRNMVYDLTFGGLASILVWVLIF